MTLNAVGVAIGPARAQALPDDGELAVGGRRHRIVVEVLPDGVLEHERAVVPLHLVVAGVDERAVAEARALVEAVVLVLILLGLFLGNVRSALTVALILPLSAMVKDPLERTSATNPRPLGR